MNILLVFLGCVSEPPVTDTDEYQDTNGSSVTWYDDVAPVVGDHCLGCHATGGVGPMALDSYEAAAPWAQAIAAVTADRSMPPWNVSNDGDCNRYIDALWLEESEIALFGEWAALGAPAGSGEEPTPPPLAALDDVDVSITVGEGYVPNTAVQEDYRCYILDVQAAADTHLVGYETKPSEPSIVHHATMYALFTPDGAAAAASLDAEDDAPGYDCNNGVQAGDYSVVGLWNPGTDATRFPEGSGIRLRGYPIVMRVHYVASPTKTDGRVTVNFDLEESVENVGVLVGMNIFDFELEPGKSGIVQSMDFTLNEKFGMNGTVKVHGNNPHMHTRGVSMSFVRDPDTDDEECLADVAVWDYSWQRYYWYEEPLVFETTDPLRLTCTFDTTSETETIVFGADSHNEMCTMAIYVTAAE